MTLPETSSRRWARHSDGSLYPLARAIRLPGRLAATVLLALGCAIPQLASADTAASIVDQEFSATPAGMSHVSSSTGDTMFGQSFTVGVAGLLSGADLLVFDGSSWFGASQVVATDITVQIRTLVSGLPTETVLASGTIPASSLPTSPGSQFTHVNFLSGIAVEPGQTLALTISGAADGWSGQIGTSATYPGGLALTRSHAGYDWVPLSVVDPGGREGDFLFRTYVQPVPEPSTLALLSAAAGAFLLHRRSRCSKGRV